MMPSGARFISSFWADFLPVAGKEAPRSLRPKSHTLAVPTEEKSHCAANSRKTFQERWVAMGSGCLPVPTLPWGQRWAL